MTAIQTEQRGRNPKAVAALALGITGLVLSPLVVGGVLGAVGAVLGMLGLRQRVRRGMAAWGMVAGILAFVAAGIFGTVYVVVPRMIQRRQEAMATANMRGLMIAVRTYASDWGGPLPQRQGQLMPYVSSGERHFRDPRSGVEPGGRRGAGLPAQGDADFYDVLDERSGFCYAAPGTLSDGRLIVFYDKAPRGGRRLVLFADNRVETFAPGSAELKAAVVRNNEAREALGLPPLPLELDGMPPVRGRKAEVGKGPETAGAGK